VTAGKKKRIDPDSGMQVIVIIPLAVGPRYYGPFDTVPQAKHWAENNWVDYEIRPIWCTD